MSNHPDEGRDVIIIGGGPGGLSVRHMLHKFGLTTLLIERGAGVGARWSEHWDSVRLNSGRGISSLPGHRIPRQYGPWVSRDNFVQYLTQYSQMSGDPIEFGASVTRVDQAGRDWVVKTSAGEYSGTAVVLATGLNGPAFVPEWAREGDFKGELVHVTQYKNSAPYAGRDVLVVGTGASAHDIALDLVNGGAGKVRVSVRTPPILAPKRMLGFSSAALTYVTKHYLKLPSTMLDKSSLNVHRRFFPEAEQYFGAPPTGMMTAFAERGHGVTMEIGLLDALKKGEVTTVPAVIRLDGDDVILADDQRIQPDVVVLATGQRAGISSIVGHLGVLGTDGRPLVHGAETLEKAPGLHFIGYRLPGGQLPDMRYDAPAIAKRLRREQRVRNA
ncbi:NAD(P)/FAD-dependent oxidoreductase [Streptomyces sp. NBC_01571]|uniref:flavin-containing monooxygenase n=1 Tax=Streptomyces sp. NBC_01571 TaxID=2975883 RepID=UPI002259AF05|nr:NAD(P)/FAD-dependent oxidoreductase [Streptomyces sp. NBC_01571]MCX4573274.1 NAD(P)/FAD-dependent oxidoreductase [Streptomyces sp. NBC_01571]